MNMSYVLIVFESMRQQNLGGKKQCNSLRAFLTSLAQIHKSTNTLDEVSEDLKTVCYRRVSDIVPDYYNKNLLKGWRS
jgi:hypothetical protein